MNIKPPLSDNKTSIKKKQNLKNLKKNDTNDTNSKKSPKSPKSPKNKNLHIKNVKNVNVTTVIRDTNDTNDTNQTSKRIKRITYHRLAHRLGSGVLEKSLAALFNLKNLTYGEISTITKDSENYIKTVINRSKEFFDEGDKKEGIKTFKLSQLGIEFVEKKIKAYEKKEKETLERKLQTKIKRKSNEDLLVEAKGYFTLPEIKILIGESIRSGESSVYIDFENLSEYSPVLCECLMADNPEEILQLLEMALEDTGLIKKPRVRITNIPETCNLPIENIRSEHLNRLISLDGRVTSLTNIRPQTVSAKFECPSCGTVITVLQLEKKFREPSRCSCGRRASFRLLSKVMVDTARMILEDLQDKTDNPHSQSINAFIKEDLTNTRNIKKSIPGNEIRVIGILKEIPIQLRTGALSVRFDHAIEVISIEELETEINIDDFSKEDKEGIALLSKKINDEGLQCINKSFAPEVQGYEQIKNSLILKLCNKRNDPNEKGVRNKSNILLMGDPGIAKTVLGDFVIDITPHSRKAIGGSSSAVGITGSLVKDEDGGYRVEPGALVLAKEELFLDELNNLSDEDKPKLQEAMNDQSVTINKASQHMKLKVTAGTLACANPRGGQFNPNRSIVEQFDIPSPILNRFDLIFVMKDKVERNKDKSIATRMIQRERGKIVPEYSKDFLKKFFVYIRHLEDPVIDDEIENILINLYSSTRIFKTKDLMINPRFLESLIRLIKASAKIRMSCKIEKEDILRALKILSKSHYQIQEYKHFDFKEAENDRPEEPTQVPETKQENL